MGGNGPPPKKEAERRRRNKSEIPVSVVNVDELLAGEVEIPDAPERWDDVTIQLYESFMASGQVIWMEPSDWATLYATCEVLDRWLKPQDVRVGENRPGQNEGGEVSYVFESKIVAMPGGVLTAIMKVISDLMGTEGSRRKLRIELERRKRLDAILGDSNVVDIAKVRADVFKRNDRSNA